MVKVTVLYPNRTGTKFDMTYYLDHHIPLVRRLLTPALKGITVEHGISGDQPLSPATYIANCNLLFESVHAYQASFGPHGQEILEDIPNYTNCDPIVQLREVKL